MNKGIILSKIEVARMDYNMQWDCHEAPRLGLRNPWQHRPDRLLNTETIIAEIEGTEVPAIKNSYRETNDEEIRLWREERDKYIELCNGFICEKIFEKFGYEAFMEECHFQNREDLLSVHFPCESADSQCNFCCPIQHDCRMRSENK